MLRELIKSLVGGGERPLSQAEFERINTFFILGMGRSGTNFLAHMLDKCAGAVVFHEPQKEDFEALVEAHGSEVKAKAYLQDFRLERMRNLARVSGIRHYGEANSNLRFHAGAIRAALPSARVLHLVRDGREVVRSVMERQHYTAGATSHHNLQPLPSDPMHACWDETSRFEKVCWLWADANRRLAEEVPAWVKFESLISDYGYFRQRLLDFIGLEMTEQQWSQSVRAPTNVTRQFTFPPWQEWDATQMADFDAICGDQMARFGYA